MNTAGLPAVYVAGVGMTPTGKFLDRSIKQLTADAVKAALADAGLAVGDIQAAFFSNATQGVLEGQTMVYYPDGAIHLARSYSDGKLDGTLLQYYPDGKLRREEHYSENQCTGGKMFDEYGTEMEHQPYFVFPSFPGGIENLMKLVANVTKYPEDAWKQKAEGRVILRFVVDEEGKMTHPKILQSVRYDIDKEAIRAFEAIADVYRWSPGYQDGEAKRVKFTIPLYFRIPK